MLENINLGAHFLFLLILCSNKIERLLFLKFLKILAFFDSYFWPFSKFEEKIKVIFVIRTILSSIWNVSIKLRWHDEKLTIMHNVALAFLWSHKKQITYSSHTHLLDPSNYYSWSLVLWQGICVSKAHKPVTLSGNTTFTKV